MKRETFIIACLTMAMIFFTKGLVGAADFHVTSDQELQTALSVATDNGENDTVLLAAGAYAGRFTFISTESFSLTIQAEAGLNPGQVVLDGEHLGRVLLLRGGSNNVNFTVDNLTLENGSVNDAGGGLNVQSSGTLMISHCIVKNNKTSGSNDRRGGGIYLNVANSVTLSENIITGNDNDDNSYNKGGGVYVEWATTLLFEKNTISDNLARQYAGAVYIRDAEDITFADNTISNNSVNGGHGGAVYFEQPVNTITFQGNRIHKNHASGSYGAMYINSAALSITFTENTISENSAGSSYAAIYTNNHTPTITFSNNIITNNTATSNYGPVYLYRFTDLVFTDNLVSGNSALYMGAGRLGNDSHNSITFTGNTVSNNSATNNSYGGFYIHNATTTYIVNNVITGNSCINGGTAGLAVAAGTTLDFINNTIANNSATGNSGGVTIPTGSGSVVNFYNNVSFGNSAPGGADLWLSGAGTTNGYNNAYQEMEGLWSFSGNNSNTAPLFIDEANDDFHLSPTSLLINTGDNSAPSIPATDLDGNPRIADITVDLGAYEHTTAGFHPADLDQDSVITAAEAADYGDAWRTGATWATGPNPIPIDYATRAGYLSTQNSGGYKNIGGGQPTNWVPGP